MNEQEKYSPIYTITDEMNELISEISFLLGKIDNINELNNFPHLRKVNRIKSIQGSLAIENNSLSIEQVTALLDGKRVLGPKEDIIAITNAYKAYDELDNIDPFNIDDLFRIHKIMMVDLVENPGKIRTSQVGVINEKGFVVHLAPAPHLVKENLFNLFKFIAESKLNIFIKSSIFHYEFEFIHPFSDGNGRLGRFWQTALLSSIYPIFKWLPIENIIKSHQEDYYESISESTKTGTINPFILYMLNIIKETLNELTINISKEEQFISPQVSSLLKIISTTPQSAKELMDKLNLKSLVGFRRNYLAPALKIGLIKMTIPDKPTSKNQRYYKD